MKIGFRHVTLAVSGLLAPALYVAAGFRVDDLPYVLDYKSLSVILLFILVSRGFVVSGLSSRVAGFLLRVRRDTWSIVLPYSIATMLLAMVATNDGAVW
jgi:di/tricarboxylate transporter